MTTPDLPFSVRIHSCMEKSMYANDFSVMNWSGGYAQTLCALVE